MARSFSVSFLASAKNGELSLKRIERIKRRDQGFSDKSQTITHNKSHTIKSHMIKIHELGCGCEDGADSSTSQTYSKKRSPGVKASRVSGMKTVVEEKTVNKFENMWSIKHMDLEAKERLSKMRLLESLIGKKEPLAEYEEALKKNLINELL
uniref:No apical meristem-associated C-terminal domain-containing protein n=1 Tax=Brassica oleracea var. oleracea TaxID=109376 RepID=A0A0D3ECK5_BRAOL